MLQQIKQFDYFRKLQQDVDQKQTYKGGIIFILTIAMLIALIGYEIQVFLFGEPLRSPFVDQYDANERIRVNMNISFNNAPCAALSVDYQDVTGTHLEDIKHTLHKLRLDSSQNFIDYNKMEKIQQFEQKNYYPSYPMMKNVKSNKAEQLNDCYGAELYVGQQCLTCSDVLLAYAQRGWPQPPVESIAQCMPNYKPIIKIINVEQELQQKLEQQIQKQLEREKEQQNQQQIQNDQTKIIENQSQDNANLQQMMSQNSDSSLQDLTEEEKKYLEIRLSELNELQFNPMGWNKQRLNEEKLDRIDDLINLLNNAIKNHKDNENEKINFNFTRSLANIQFKKNDDEFLLSKILIHRKSCESDITYKLKIQMRGLIPQHDIISDNQRLLDHYTLKKGQCQQIMNINVTKHNLQDNYIKISIKEMEYTEILHINSTVWEFFFQLSEDDPKQPNIGTASNFTLLAITRIDRLQQQDQQKQKVESNRRVLFSEEYGNEQDKIQVINSFDIFQMQQQIEAQEGCQLYGHMFIKRVPGNFHISFHSQGRANVYFNKIFSMNHTINLLEFTNYEQEVTLGQYIKNTNPIDNTFHGTEEAGTDHTYYIKIVNAQYENLLWDVDKLYQYTILESLWKKEPQFPSVTFKYEFDPITMLYHSKNRNLISFLISFCAILGGVFSLSKFFHSLFEK